MPTTTPELHSAPPIEQTMLEEIYRNVVTHMPPGGLTLMFVLLGLTLIVGLWIVFSQHALARNQVKIAEMLQQHLAEHEKKSGN